MQYLEAVSFSPVPIKLPKGNIDLDFVTWSYWTRRIVYPTCKETNIRFPREDIGLLMKFDFSCFGNLRVFLRFRSVYLTSVRSWNQSYNIEASAEP